MRYLSTATMAASVLAIGLTVDPAMSLPLGGKVTGADTAIQKVQQDKGGGGPGPGGGAGAGPGAGGGPAAGSPGRGNGGGGAMRGGGGGMREGGAQFRSGDKSMRGNGGTQFRAERGLRGDRERGVRRDRDRADVNVDRGRDRRRFGRRGVIVEGGYGYVPTSCEWLRRRALATDSPYWWRRFRACRAGF